MCYIIKYEDGKETLPMSYEDAIKIQEVYGGEIIKQEEDETEIN